MEPSENQDAPTGQDAPTSRESDPDIPSPADTQNRGHPAEILPAATGHVSIRFVE